MPKGSAFCAASRALMRASKSEGALACAVEAAAGSLGFSDGTGGLCVRRLGNARAGTRCIVRGRQQIKRGFLHGDDEGNGEFLGVRGTRIERDRAGRGERERSGSRADAVDGGFEERNCGGGVSAGG